MLLSSDHWSHCAGRDNPADIPSRGCTPQQLADSQLWMSGPEWLRTVELNPSKTLQFQMPEECQVEMKANKAETTLGLLAAVAPTGLGEIMNCDNYSSLTRLFSVTATVLKFCRLLLSKIHLDSATTAFNDCDLKRQSLCGWLRPRRH